MPNSPIIWLESPIAGGKSTLGSKLAQELGFLFLEEPISANPFLEAFYQDQKRWAYPMQIHLLHHRYGMKQHAAFAAATGAANGVIVDRCIVGDRVFAKLHYEEGNIHELEWQSYNYCFQMMARTFQAPTVLLYLDVQPETALRRLKARNRKEERLDEIDEEWWLGYLRKLKRGYEDLIRELKMGLCPWAHSVEVERIVWDRDTLTDEEWTGVAATIRDACERR